MYPCQLRADFQQYYHLNIDDMGNSYSYEHAAVLVVQLPKESRVRVAQDPNSGLSIEAQLLWLIEYYTHWLMWSRTTDAPKDRNKPKMLPLPSAQAEEKKRLERTNREFVDKVLGVNTSG